MNKKVMVCASDTFRAAAVDQLTIWARAASAWRSSSTRWAPTPPPSRTTPAKPPRARGIDVLIVDTAGRLHTQDHLMRELTKIRDVVAKRIEGAPHEVLLVLDATTGQNAIHQAKNFRQGDQRHRHHPRQARRHRQGRRGAARSRISSTSPSNSSAWVKRRRTSKRSIRAVRRGAFGATAAAMPT